MHPNAQLLHQLFSSLDRRDDASIATCYHPHATFRDIAFDLHGKDQIHGMWRMICAGDIRVTFEIVDADDEQGHVKATDVYTFSETGRRVRNVIDSRFRFADRLIIEQRDDCDPRAWAAMAIGGVGGFMAGRLAPLRRFKARQKLQKFMAAPRAA